MNNVSSMTLSTTVIQVGDNVTLADVHVADWLVPISTPVQLTIDCPRGWPVVLTVDMGDGEPPQRIPRPAAYDSATDDRTVPRRRGQLTGTTTSSTPAGQSRRRRDVAETADFGQPFQLSYRYRRPGSYRFLLRQTV